jgi:dolichyl-phosphate beta-glucosyltransferase
MGRLEADAQAAHTRMTPAQPSLSLIVPAYNEAQRIESTVRAIVAHLEPRFSWFEIIVWADGDDGTRERVAGLASADPRISVGGTPERRGKGRGIREGVARSRGALVGFVDADYKTPIEEMDLILPWFDRGYDVVIGSRAVGEATIEVAQPRYRQLGSAAFGLAMHTIVGLPGIRDTQCGFKFFRGPVARDLFRRQVIDGYMFDVEVLYLAERAGHRIKEVGIRWRDDGDSRLQLVSGNWRNMLDLFRIRLHSYGEASSEEALAAGD